MHDIRNGNNRSDKCISEFSWHTNQLDSEEECSFFSRAQYLDKHSKDIVSVIHNSWTKASGLFAWCEYEDGKLKINQPHEPEVTNSGLARQHLITGYQHYAWNFYRNGKAESVEICNKIKKIIESYQNKILSEIDKDILTSAGNRKLERKTESDVYPRKFDFNSLYLHRRILEKIFQELNNRINNKKQQEIWMNEIAGYWDLKIGDPNSSTGTTIGLGDKEMMEELKKKVEKLLDDSTIQNLVKDYYSKISELETNSNVTQYEDERKEIWRNIDREGKRINGECEKCSKEYLDSLF